MPEPQHKVHDSAPAYCCVIIFHFRAHEMFLRTAMIIFDSWERRNVVISKLTKSSWLKWGLLLLPVCLKHSFCLFEILHIKQSVMICLSLAGSFVMECDSFCRFASSCIPWKWSVLQLWILFSLFVAFCTWKALAVFCYLVCVPSAYDNDLCACFISLIASVSFSLLYAPMP